MAGSALCRRRLRNGKWRPGVIWHGRLRHQVWRGAAALALVVGGSATAQVMLPPPASAASSHATLIAAGNAHACIIRAGQAYCWGLNSSGQLGNSSTTQSLVPVAVTTSGVLAGKTLTQITAGNSHTCALDSSGTAYCWGANGNGQLGNSSTTQSLVPVAVTTSGVLSGKTLTQISADENGMYTCALDSAGAAYCWGAASFGQLGNGGVASTPGVPVAVVTSGVLSGKVLTQIATGSGSTCAVASTGAAYCWGQGVNGELGERLGYQQQRAGSRDDVRGTVR